MAKRKTRKSTKNAKRYSQKKKSNIDVVVVGVIVLSILLAVLIYTNSGYMGKCLNEVLGGMMGILKYIFPIGTFAIAIKIACKNNEYLRTKLIQYLILLICIAVVMSVYQVSKGALNVDNELSEVIKDAYKLGTKDIGGGALGTLAAVPLTKLLGNVGAVILSVGISIMLFVFTFGIEFSEMIENFVENQQEKQLERKEEKLKNTEDRATIREKRRKEREEKILARQKQKEEAIQIQEEQIKINLNGRLLEGEQDTKLKKYNHGKDDIVPLGMEEVKKQNEPDPDFIEGNLFKKEEEKKEDKTKEVLQLEHAQIVEDEHYEYPPVNLLSKGTKKGLKGGAKALTDTATKLQKTLYSFGVSAKVENVSVGPSITRYELKPAEGVRVSKIANLADDIALSLAAETIRIEAPIPGKQAVRNRSAK